MPKRTSTGSEGESSKRGKKEVEDATPPPATPVGSSSGQASCSAPAQGSAAAAADENVFPTEESMPHLCCSVCLAFPEGEVLQCCSGHILCRTCYDRVCHEEKPTCPTCREPLDLLKPIRNMLAQQSIARLRVGCPHEGCNECVTRGTLVHHMRAECAFRKVACKYEPIGCKWSGVASGLARHEDRCKKAEQPGWKLLKRVQSMRDDTAAAHAAALSDAKAGLAVVGMLESRCRNIEFTSVQLHKCSSHEHIAGVPAHLVSPAFHALGFRWRLFTLSENSASRYSVVLQLRDCRVPVPADFFVLRGQPLEVTLRPACSSHTFAVKNRSSDPVVIAEGSAAEALSDVESLTLRIGLIDKRSGRLDRGFMGQMHPGYAGEEDWDEDDVGSHHGDLASMDDSEDAFSESGDFY